MKIELKKKDGTIEVIENVAGMSSIPAEKTIQLYDGKTIVLHVNHETHEATNPETKEVYISMRSIVDEEL